MYIVFDTETTGLPRDWNAPITDTSNWPRVVQLAWQLHDDYGQILEHQDFLVIPDGFDVPFDAERVHGISTQLAASYGEPLEIVIQKFLATLEKTDFLVGHNVQFDVNILSCELVRLGIPTTILEKQILDTCTEATAVVVGIPMGKGRYKKPTLSELYHHLFQEQFAEAHNATADVEATARCFFELIRKNHFSKEELKKDAAFLSEFITRNPLPFQLLGLNHVNLKSLSQSLVQMENIDHDEPKENEKKDLSHIPFAHLHNHTQFSILQSTITIQTLVKKAVEYKMPAVALTDTSNMMGAFLFEKTITEHNKGVRARNAIAKENGEKLEDELMPIIGGEFYVCRNRLDKTQKDNGNLVVLLAKNKNGYQNLIKLASYAYTEGMYYVPRIDKSLLVQYKEDLIVLSGSLYGEIPSLLLNVGENQAEDALLWWKKEFGDDFYLEIMRHGQENEDRINKSIIKFSEKHQVKLVATNNTYYIDKKDADAHDVLLCVKDNELVSTPKGSGRGYRYGLENQEYYFKSQEEMQALFADLPEAIASIQEIISKCEPYTLSRDVLLPAFDIPDEFKDAQDEIDGGKRGENNYLRHLTYEGARKRYDEITEEIQERLDFELATIEKTGYPGYFLIVQDFCQAARDMGVSVGPGRGSAAGSAVAYCTGITNVDPIKYDLLFERFLNPDRVSMPDIDIDFDDEGRGRVIDWVIKKYGSNQVAQIITYGTMAAKSSIRDTARVMDLPLTEADRIAKMVPDLSLKKLFEMSDAELAEKLRNNQDDLAKAKELRQLFNGSDLSAAVVRQAQKLEGSVRNTGIHACGVIITPDDITNFVPVATAKDSEMYCTQYDNSVAESAGLLKMDFLGLKTLTLIKDAVRNVKQTKGIDLDPDSFPIDDEKTYQLFQRGETVGIFQYESTGMQKYMRELKPTVFADLIAMNALYRPGPLEYIPSFIKRKHGEEAIVYDLDDCEEYLKETYGITVYQEQVMLLSQKLAGFSKGEADTLRKAMGKKQKEVLDKMKPLFLERGAEKGHDIEKLEKIWKDWEAFALYAFNKSHSTCYAWIAYQTAYLKANYPAEYMSSVLSNNMNDMKQVTFFMEECRRMGLSVLGPDVNESNYFFTVNKDGAVRFGLGAIKGLGSSPVEAIISERKENGPFVSVFDFAKRVNPRNCNRTTFESLVYGGGFDSFKEMHRAQFFVEDTKGKLFLDSIMRYGAEYQKNLNSPQIDIFSTDENNSNLPEPVIPKAEEWGTVFRLNKEKEVIGIFISGHPLDDFKVEINSFCNGTVEMLNHMPQNRGRDLHIPAIITEAEHRFTKNGDPFGTLTIEDYHDSYKLFLWRENYLKFRHFIQPGTFVAIKGKIEIPPRRSELEFVIHSIELLQNLKENKAKSIHLKVSSKAITHSLVMDINKLCQDNEGKCSLHFTVFDQLDDLEVRMTSKTIKVNPTNTFFNELDKMEVTYEIR